MYFIYLFTIVAIVSANCPAVKPVDNFQFAVYGQGIWYEVARYPNKAEDGTACVQAEFIPEGDVIKVKNYFVRDNKAGTVEEIVSIAPGAGQSGNVLFSYSYGSPDQVDTFVDILDVDYDKYLIEYSCKFDEASQKIREYAWVFSRSKVLPDDAKVAVEKFLKESEILDSKRFEWTSFSEENCKVNA